MKDAYKSLIEALMHGGIANRVKVNLDWIESEIFEKEDPAPFLEHVHGILVPGGFGHRGAEGKIKAATFARAAQGSLFRHLLRHADGGDRGGAFARRHHRRQLDRVRPYDRARRRPDDRMDAAATSSSSARPTAISAAPCGWAPMPRRWRRAPRSREIYGTTEISERHRHRYEVNMGYRDRLEAQGMSFCGLSPDGLLPETDRISGPSLVHRRAVPPRAEIAPLRAASAVCELRPGRDGAEPAGLRRVGTAVAA